MAKNSSIFRRIVQLWIDADSVRRTKAALQDALNKGTDVKGLKRNFRAADAAMASLKRTALGLGASFLAVFSARKLVEYADTWKLIQGRLKLVTTDTKNLAEVTQSLQGIAARTRSSFDSVARLYTRVAMNAEQLGRSQQEVLDLTETVSKSIQIGGASASEAAAGVQQLAQALASGRLQGDEFRSIMENMPDLARRLAEELGVTTGELRAMSKAGELTSDVLVDALLRMKKAVDEDFKNVPVTIGGAFTVLGNEVMEFVGVADEGTEASSAWADAILAVAQAIDMASGALKRFNEAKNRGGATANPLLAGAAVPLDLSPEEIARLRARGTADDIRQQRGLEMLRPAAAGADLFEPLINRLASERTAQLVKLKAAGAATAAEIAELNKLYADGNKMLHAGNLLVEQRADLVSALAALGFEETKAKTQEQLNRLEDERIKDLTEAVELGLATRNEVAELVGLQVRLNNLVEDGNLSIAERLRRTEQIRAAEEALVRERERNARGTRSVDAFIRGTMAGPDLLAGRRDSEGNLKIRAPAIGVDPETLDQVAQNWIDANRDILEAGESTAFGVANAWQDAFGLLFTEGATLGQFMGQLGKGLGAAFLGGLAQLASAKVKENIARAIEVAAGGVAAFVFGDPTKIGPATKAAAGFTAAAAAWGALAGAAGGAQGALAGGGAAGLSGGIPSGARDPAGRIADRLRQERTTIVYVNMDALNPRDGRYQSNVGQTMVYFNQRRGKRITDGAGGIGGST